MPYTLSHPKHPGHILTQLTQKLENLHESMEFQLTSPNPDETLVTVYESTCWELYELLCDKYHIEEAFFEYSLFSEEFQPILAAAIKAQDRASYLIAEYWTPERAGEAQERSAKRFEDECKALVEECEAPVKECKALIEEE